jgi:hypothetical protein
MAKKLPAPFKRPSIAIEIAGAQKEWQDVPPRLVDVGDIIQGKGLVIGWTRVSTDMEVTNGPIFRFVDFRMKNGTTYRVSAEEKIRAFVKVSHGNG